MDFKIKPYRQKIMVNIGVSKAMLSMVDGGRSKFHHINMTLRPIYGASIEGLPSQIAYVGWQKIRHGAAI